MRGMAESSCDAVVTDPPYGLGFMGKGWDHGVPGIEFWTESLRVAKPGAHLLAFGGTRTFHRLVCAIEDAGWEIRDRVLWLYGSGFPKSRNLHDEWEGWGTALKPAHEPIIVVRKPFKGTVTANVLIYGTGALNVDGCRVGTDDTRGKSSQTALGVMNDDGWKPREVMAGSSCGRWPANVIHDGSEEVLAAFPHAPGQQGDLKNHSRDRVSKGRYGDMAPAHDAIARIETDKSAARFFYCTKASKSDRGEGNTHPTVKPVKLMTYLCRLITPPNGVILDPFMGSGSTGVACVNENFSFVGIEKEVEYFRIAQQRIGDAGL